MLPVGAEGMSPPAEIGLLRSPVRLTIERGYATRIEGGAEAAVYENGKQIVFALGIRLDELIPGSGREGAKRRVHHHHIEGFAAGVDDLKSLQRIFDEQAPLIACTCSAGEVGQPILQSSFGLLPMRRVLSMEQGTMFAKDLAD